MIQVNIQNTKRKQTLTFLKTLSGSVKNTLTVVALFFALAVGQQAQAQSSEEPFHISVGEKLKDFQLAQLSGLDEASLTFTVPAGDRVSGDANMLANYAFPAAGTYTIAFTRVQHQGHGEPDHTCNHYALPDQITVVVNPHRIEYLTETISFSQNMVGGQPTEHITMSIQVSVTGDNVLMPTQFYSSGIETTITGQLNPQQSTLSTGTHTLQYQLQGMGKPGTYIQFNFQDANGHDVPCGITTPL